MSNGDWSQRTLCSDGNCIGIIGADGRCRECGKLFEGEISLETTDDEPLQEDPAPSEDVDESGQEDPPAIDTGDSDTGIGDDESWENRKLCSDGGCIGIIGSDGRCRVCGKPYKEAVDNGDT